MKTSILLLCYGDHYALAKRALDSIVKHAGDCELIIGLNAVCEETRKLALRDGDVVLDSPENLGKPKMMARMMAVATGDLVWWFDDDSYIGGRDALLWREGHVNLAPENEILWGHVHYFSQWKDFWAGPQIELDRYILAAHWFRGLAYPCGVTGYLPDWPRDRWFFVTGGCWIGRRKELLSLPWPDVQFPQRAEDVLLCEAVRQRGYSFKDIGPAGCVINAAPRRGGW
jgi:hypothetical protein